MSDPAGVDDAMELAARAAGAWDVVQLREEVARLTRARDEAFDVFTQQISRVEDARDKVLEQLVQLRAHNAALRAALETARETIQALHGPVAWEIYERASPEMAQIAAALSLSDEALELRVVRDLVDALAKILAGVRKERSGDPQWMAAADAIESGLLVPALRLFGPAEGGR